MSESGFPDVVRFVEAQDFGGTYATALAELRRGHKTSHWMWFVLPQVAGLGQSPTAVYYGVRVDDGDLAGRVRPDGPDIGGAQQIGCFFGGDARVYGL